MITSYDFFELISKKMCNDISKGVIRMSNPPQVAQIKCDAIDAREKTEHFMRFVKEVNECEMRWKYAVLQYLMR